MRKFALVLVLILCHATFFSLPIVVLVVIAQEKPNVPAPPGNPRIVQGGKTSASSLVIGSESMIQDLESFGHGELEKRLGPRVEACGRYFKHTPPEPSDKASPGALFFVSVEKANDGYLDVRVFPWPTDKFQVRVIRNLGVPRLKILQNGGPLLPWAEIAISEEDLAEAPCLKNLKKGS